MTRNISIVSLLCAAFMVAGPQGQDRPNTVRRVARAIPDQYIVALAANADSDAVGRDIASTHQGRLKHVYRRAMRGFAMEMSASAAAVLARDPRVLYVEEDGVVDVTDVQSSPPWGLDRLDQRLLPLDATYTYPRGSRVVHVHVIDTGIRASHQEFGGRASIAGDYVDDDHDGDPNDVGNDDGNPGTPDGADCHGHGTHVAGIIGGAIYGVAKSVVIHAYRVMDCSGEGATSAVIAAIDAVTADGRRPAVVNMSLGGNPSTAMDDAIRRSIAAGVTYVVAAGNSSVNASTTSPARVAEAITVGATDSNDARAWFSNFGPVLDVFAPGVAIDSASIASDSAIVQLSGTSMAAPHVAGAAALYLQSVGDKPPVDVRNTLIAAATLNAVSDPGSGSPNVLLYTGFLNTSAPSDGGGGRINVALAANGGAATASSAYGPEYPVSATINGERRGAGWAAGGAWMDATSNAFPDWVEVAFNGSKTIDEVDVFSLQDAWANPSEPTASLTFTAYGLADFTVQYWTGTAWQAVPGGVIRDNTLVWRSLTFAAVTTTKIRVLTERGLNAFSRVVEIEAYAGSAGGGGGGGGTNLPPIVTLTSPGNGATLTAPATVALGATASDPDGTVRDVTFYANGAAVGTDTTSPYSGSWTGVAAGIYTVTAVATDLAGAATTSVAAQITVTAPPPPGGRVNVALAANGGTATASSAYGPEYPVSATNNGDRRGAGWAAGGAWMDATSNAFPDWVEVAFNGSKTIDEVDVFSLQDAWANPSEPTASLTFTAYGLADFTVQYWTGAAWQAVPGGVIRDNTLVWRSLTFAAVTTTKIRVLTERGLNAFSRVVEIEAYAGSGSGGGGGGTNLPPIVTLTSPGNGATLTAPATVALGATASDPDGTVRDVTFYANGAAVGTDTTSPYSGSWTGVAAGIYTVTAVATDLAGAATTSVAAQITVTAPPPPGGRVNVALAANGGTATASSAYGPEYPVSATNNGDRRGAGWAAGGAWMDATANAFPDWVEVAFNGSKTIDEVDVFSLQDAWANPSEPTASLTFTAYGLADFTVQYWTGTAWQGVPGGVIRDNALVWRSLTFAAVTTTKIRVLTERGLNAFSRLVEIEAYAGSAGGGGTAPPVAVEWFVASGGNGSGSSAAPYGRIQDALAVAQPGETITVRPGTYAETLGTIRNGVAGSPITLRAAGGRGSVLVTALGRVLTVSHSYLSVDGFVLDGQYGLDDLVRIANSGHFFELRNSELRRTTKDLIDMGNVQGVSIIGCLLHHALNAANGRTDAHGIAAAAVTDLLIRDSEIHTFSGDGLQVDPGRSAPGWNRVTVERTRIWLAPLPAAENGFPAGATTGENAIDTKASNSFPRATIVLRDIVASGFRGAAADNFAAFNLKENVDVTVDRVTVYDSDIAFRLRGPASGGASVAIKNAVVYNTTTAFRYEDDVQNLRIWNVTIGSNVTRAFLAASSTSTGLDVRNLLILGGLPPEASHSSNLSVTAQAFVNAAQHDYQLSAGSAAIDVGVAITEVATDRGGFARPQGAAYDVGAFERR